MRMAKDHRPPGINQVDILISIFIKQVCAFRFLHENRISTYGPKCPHGRIHTTGNKLLGFFKKRLTARRIFHDVILCNGDAWLSHQGYLTVLIVNKWHELIVVTELKVITLNQIAWNK